MEALKTKVIAFCGKGGAGKTSLCALTIKYLAHKNKRVLAIDADPAGGLSWALGIKPYKTLDDLRVTLHTAVDNKSVQSSDELYAMANYELLASLVEHRGFDFLSVGRPEAEGCYCSINAFLRHCIGKLTEHYEYVCIDGEAGLEQVNRRVLETVSHLVIVSDTSKRSIEIAYNLLKLAQQRTQTMHCGVIINKMGDSTCANKQLPVIGTLPVSSTIATFDSEGRSLLEMSDDEEYYTRFRELLKKYI
ncbi:MAG: AAA family ATPase [Spirochaetota bacterium]